MNPQYPRMCVAAGIIMLLAFTASNAQPQLIPENTILPLLGMNATQTQYWASPPANVSGLAAMGENMTWDLTGETFGNPTVLVGRYVEPPFTDLPAGTWVDWDNANFAFVYRDAVEENSTDSVEYAQYRSFSQYQLVNYGSAWATDVDMNGSDDALATVYNPSEVEMTFPTALGSAWDTEVDEILFLGLFNSSGGLTIKKSTQVVGWGMLVTPSGSSEVLQLNQSYVLSAFGIEGERGRRFMFIGPIQDVAGKGSQVWITANVEFNQDDTMTEVAYTVTEIGGRGSTTAAENRPELPDAIQLHQNYPNPFNPSTTVPFSIKGTGHVVLTIHDLLGREVARLLDRVMTTGDHSASWDAGNLPSGVYRARLSVDGDAYSRAIVFSK